jgi:hypothetical protein
MPDIAKYAHAIAEATTEELHANLRAADDILIPTAAAQFKAALQAAGGFAMRSRADRRAQDEDCFDCGAPAELYFKRCGKVVCSKCSVRHRVGADVCATDD